MFLPYSLTSLWFTVSSVIDEGRLRGQWATAAPGAVSVALSQQIELEPYREAIADGRRPRHVLLDLADATGGAAVTGFGAKPTLRDRLGGLIIGDAKAWWVARQAMADADGGFLYTNNENVGFAILALCRLSRRRSHRVGFWVMTPSGRRVRCWLRLLRLLRLRPFLVAESEQKAEALRRFAGPTITVASLGAPVDLRFFSPGPTLRRQGALVVSAGLECRDYRTLAAAVDGLTVNGQAVEVKICAVSPDTNSTSATMPDQLPANVSFVDLDMAGLRDLYREADLVVVPTTANAIDAGTSTVTEALACGRPVVASAQGVYPALADSGQLRVAPIGSADTLRTLIGSLLAAPAEANRMGQAARAVMEASQDDRQWLVDFIEQLCQSRTGAGDQPSRAAAPDAHRPSG